MIGAGRVGASLAGISPLSVVRRYVAAVCALFRLGHPGIACPTEIRADRQGSAVGSADFVQARCVVIVVLGSAIAANVGAHLLDAHILDTVPLIGLAVAAAILLTAPIARPDWSIVPRAARGAMFLLALVSAASMMPVKSLPLPSWETALGLGFVSAVFDNIPLTALAIKQGNLMPEARPAARSGVKEGWPVVLAMSSGSSSCLRCSAGTLKFYRRPDRLTVHGSMLRRLRCLSSSACHRLWSCFGWETDSKGHLRDMARADAGSKSLPMATKRSPWLGTKRRSVVNDGFTIPAQARPLSSRQIGERSCFGSLG